MDPKSRFRGPAGRWRSSLAGPRARGRLRARLASGRRGSPGTVGLGPESQTEREVKSRVHLVVGPTSAGKSEFIESRGLAPVSHAFERNDKAVPATGALHYNLLFAAAKYKTPTRGVWDLGAEPVLRTVLRSGKVDAVTVIVAQIAELIERATERTAIERQREDLGTYPSTFWLDAIRSCDLYAMYEMLFELLESAGLDYDVVYSSSAMGFVPSDRTVVHRNLRGEMPDLPAPAEVDAVIALPGAEYQEVLLPHGRRTGKRVFSHLRSDRNATFTQFANVDFRDRSVLDIGSALGDMLFRAERRGARRLMGIELMEKRFEASRAIKSLLGSGAELVNSDFLEARFDEPFDDVLILNVIHHVSDIRGFLRKAAGLARDRLIIEFPTPGDKKFRSLGQVPWWLPKAVLARLPILGVSHSDQDQTFVVTRPALERILSEVGTFAPSA